jgi:hypothetical protein
MKHKHYDCIVAWADGAQIQRLSVIHNQWEDIDMNGQEWYEHYKYRIKPEPKPDVVVYSRVVGKFLIGCGNIEINQLILRPYADNPNIKYTFDGEWGNLKSAEVL